MKYLNQKKGYTLIELLTAIAIMSILAGVTVVTTRGQNLTQTKKDLKRSAMLFETKLATCASSAGSWTVAKTACYNATKATFFKNLNYTCPAQSDCKIHLKTDTNQTPNLDKYICLSIERTISGGKIQVFARFETDSPGYNPIILCGAPTSFLAIATKCGDDISTVFGGVTCPWK